MSRAYKCKGFDYTTGQPFAITLDECAKLISKAHFVTRVSVDALLKDKQGKGTHEIYNYKDVTDRIAEKALKT